MLTIYGSLSPRAYTRSESASAALYEQTSCADFIYGLPSKAQSDAHLTGDQVTGSIPTGSGNED